MSLMEVKNLSKRFGGVEALQDFSMEVKEGELRGIIGPNGAGKTTLFNLISGFMKPDKGKVIFRGEEITRFPSHIIAKKGLVRTFQTSELFINHSVEEHVLTAFHLHADISTIEALLNLPWVKRKEERIRQMTMKVIDFMGLKNLKNELAKNLSIGHKRLLGIAVALAAQPKLLMLDEPVAGMSSMEASQMVSIIRKIRDEMGITILIVEHNMKVIMGLSETITVLDFGKKIAMGTPKEISSNPLVIEAYLGSNHQDN